VTHRLEIRDADDTTVSLEFQGLLDTAALRSLEAFLISARGEGTKVRLVLRSGTEVERSVLPVLRLLDVTLEIESPYLARWLAREP
jgi:hypothetical protein